MDFYIPSIEFTSVCSLKAVMYFQVGLVFVDSCSIPVLGNISPVTISLNGEEDDSASYKSFSPIGTGLAAFHLDDTVRALFYLPLDISLATFSIAPDHEETVFASQ